MQEKPKVLIIAGPNGAGKTTFATEYLPEEANCLRFVNADLIAAGLSPFDPDAVQFRAGRLMLEMMDELTRKRESFAIETTLSGHLYRHWIHRWRVAHYRIALHFLSLSSDALAISRVTARMRAGGHGIPENIVQRRFAKGWRNLDGIYLDLVDEWIVYDTSEIVPVVRSAKVLGLNDLVVRQGQKESPKGAIEGAATAMRRAAKVAHQQGAERSEKIAIWRDEKVQWIDPIVDQ